MRKNHEHPPDKLTKSRSSSTLLTVICILLIVGALIFLLYYHIIQPYLSNRSMERYRQLYHTTAPPADNVGAAPDKSAAKTRSTETQPTEAPLQSEAASKSAVSSGTEAPADTGSHDFAALQTCNKDICGWITIPDTNIDYPIVQAADADASSYYLTHNLDGAADKNGSLVVDYRTPIRSDSRNIVINGHNMKSTGLMFRELINYNKLDFYRKSPLITFDTPTADAQWKIFALIKTNNNEKHGERFTYFRDDFSSDEDFMEFVYQLELRSIYHYPVTVNERDTLLILSTCTYEMDDMRLLVVARKVRDGESAEVDTDAAGTKDCVLYPDAWYDIYQATRPEITSFADAKRAGILDWYDGILFSN